MHCTCWGDTTGESKLSRTLGGATANALAEISPLVPPNLSQSPPLANPASSDALQCLPDKLTGLRQHNRASGETLDSVWMWVPKELKGLGTWQPATPLPTARSGMATCVAYGRLFTFGGSYTPTVESFDGTRCWSCSSDERCLSHHSYAICCTKGPVSPWSPRASRIALMRCTGHSAPA